MTTITELRETVDLLFAPAVSYCENPPALRRLQDLTDSLGIPVDLAASGWLCRVAPLDEGGFALTATLPSDGTLPTINATGKGATWCTACCETAYALHLRLDRVERDQQRDAEPELEAA